jgi:hypothetical protein
MFKYNTKVDFIYKSQQKLKKNLPLPGKVKSPQMRAFPSNNEEQMTIIFYPTLSADDI